MKNHFSQRDILEMRVRLKKIPIVSPKEIAEAVYSLGYKGQEDAVASIAVMMNMKLKRIHSFFYNGKIDLPNAADCSLLVSPSGAGKTFLMQLIGDILNLPTVIIDCTPYSAAGYTGEEPIEIITRLYKRAEENIAYSAIGIVVLDEMDKLGQHTDSGSVGKIAVQESFLTMLGSDQIEFPSDFSSKRKSVDTLVIPTPFLSVVATGVFESILAQTKNAIRFTANEQIEKKNDPCIHEKIIKQGGMLTELIGRFERIIQMESLSDEMLKAIFAENIWPNYQRSFKEENINLTIEECTIAQIVNWVKKRSTGARTFHALLAPVLDSIAFNLFGQSSVFEVCIKSSAGSNKLDWSVVNETKSIFQTIEKHEVPRLIKSEEALSSFRQLIGLKEANLVKQIIKQASNNNSKNYINDLVVPKHPHKWLNNSVFKQKLIECYSYTTAEKMLLLAALPQLSEYQLRVIIEGMEKASFRADDAPKKRI